MLYQDKKRRRIPKKRLLFLSIIVIVLIVFITGIIMLLTTKKFSLTKMPFSAKNEHLTIGNNIIYSDNDMIDSIDTSLKPIWKVKLLSKDLKYTSNDYLIACVGENVIAVLDSKGTSLFSTQLNGTIESVRLGKDKVAVYTQQVNGDKTYSYLIIFNLSGKSIYQIDVTNKYILDYGLDKDSGLFFVLELDTSGASPISIITTYKPETQAITGVKELEDQLIEKIMYNNGTLYTMGTNRLSVYSSLNTDPKEILVYGWVPEDTNTDGNIKFVYIPSSESKFIDIARIIDVTGDEVKINLPPKVFKILYTGDKIYCFATNNIFVYTGDGKFLRSYDLPSAIDGAQRAMDGYVFLTEADSVYLLKLP